MKPGTAAYRVVICGPSRAESGCCGLVWSAGTFARSTCKWSSECSVTRAAVRRQRSNQVLRCVETTERALSSLQLHSLWDEARAGLDNGARTERSRSSRLPGAAAARREARSLSRRDGKLSSLSRTHRADRDPCRAEPCRAELLPTFGFLHDTALHATETGYG